MATATKPKRKYTRRKIMTGVTDKPVPTESSFMEGLRKTLTTRGEEIAKRLAEIEQESATLHAEDQTLRQEQEKIQAGLKALEK